jgi:SAM-dependent methyltransferase
MSQSQFDPHSATYQSDVNQSIAFSGLTVDFFTQGKADHLKSLLSGYFDHNQLSILDVGCGIGNIHPMIQSHFVTGIDVSHESLKVAQANNSHCQYYHYDGVKFPFEDNTFDATFTICVMHHVPPSQWESFMGEMKRVTKPGGMVIVFEHNPYNPLTLWAVNRCEFDKDAVLLKHSKTQLLMNDNGLHTTHTDFLFFTPFKHSFFKRLDQKLAFIPLGAQYCTYAIKEDIKASSKPIRISA